MAAPAGGDMTTNLARHGSKAERPQCELLGRSDLAGILRHARRETPASDVTASRFGCKLPEFEVLTGPCGSGESWFEPRRCMRLMASVFAFVALPCAISAQTAERTYWVLSLQGDTLCGNVKEAA